MIGLFWGSFLGTAVLLLLSDHSAGEPTRGRSRLWRGSIVSRESVVWKEIALATAVAVATLAFAVPVLALITFFAIVIGLRQRRIESGYRTHLARSQAWPDAIDFLISSIRAGMSIGSALIALEDQGPQILKPILLPARQALENGSSVVDALRLIRARAEDSVADRICLVLQISQEVGGSDLGSILRSLANYVRSESRTRSELISRQSWTVNAAKLAAVAPWLIVLLLSIRAHDAYATATGSTLLLFGSLATSLGYGWMRRAARLPVAARLS